MHAASWRGRHPALFAAALMGLICVSQTFFYALPAYVQMMGKGWGFSESQIGLVVMAEIAGSSFGSLLVSFALARLPVRRVLAFAVLALTLGNASLMTPPSHAVAMLARTVTGTGTGIVAGVTLKYLARSGTHLSVLAVVQGLYTTALLTLVMPSLPSATTAYGMIVVLAGAAAPVALLFARGEALVDPFAQAAVAVVRRGAYLSLLSLLALAAACGILWTFIGHLGAGAGLDERTMSRILGAVTMVALSICLVLPRLIAQGRRFGTTLALLLACAASAAALVMPITLWSFALCTLVFFTGWNGALILLYSSVAAYDPVGRHVAMCNAFMGMGFAIGSTTGGWLIEGFGGPPAFALASAFSLVSASLYARLRTIPQPGPAGVPAKRSTAPTAHP